LAATAISKPDLQFDVLGPYPYPSGDEWQSTLSDFGDDDDVCR
jgi:hypothetical protein